MKKHWNASWEVLAQEIHLKSWLPSYFSLYNQKFWFYQTHYGGGGLFLGWEAACSFFKNPWIRAGELSQRIRGPFAENPVSVPSIHIVAINCNSSSMGYDALVWLLGAFHVRGTLYLFIYFFTWYTYMQAKHPNVSRFRHPILIIRWFWWLSALK